MSRIDEALRRAGEQAPAGPTRRRRAGLAARPETASDAVALAREPFPVEAPDAPRRGRRPAAAPIPGVSELPRVRRRPASEPSRTLFERIDARLTEKVVVDENMSPASREQYRRLAAALHDAQSTTGLQVVMVASAVAGEGKTLTASNLALTFSESYQKRVLLIDARPAPADAAHGLPPRHRVGPDRRPAVHRARPSCWCARCRTRLAVLPAGRPSSDPMAGLTSERMRRLLDEARQAFDWVIIDTPPVVLLPDANLLASMVDGAVLVVSAGSTPHELVQRAVDAIGRARILGVVLNRAEPSGPARITTSTTATATAEAPRTPAAMMRFLRPPAPAALARAGRLRDGAHRRRPSSRRRAAPGRRRRARAAS